MKKNYKIAIVGANGFVGTHLQNLFSDVIVLNRDENVEEIYHKLKDVEVVINLAGAPIVKRWNTKYKDLLYKSRIETTKKLVDAINLSSVKYFISTSAIGIYPNHKVCDESSSTRTDDFLATLCTDWEKEAMKCSKPTSIIRLGVVLAKDGGALHKMLLPFNLGLGGIIGDGKMMTSWIAMNDLMKIYQFLIVHRKEGVFNAVSQHPVSNTTFTKALGKVLRRPTIIPMPTFVLKLIFGEASCILTDSKEIYPKRLLELGFEFEYTEIEDALIDLLGVCRK